MITVAYSGVHQAYQLALAAQEAGLLDAFHCSLYDAPGKWGGVLSAMVGQRALVNRRLPGIDVTRVHEHPAPLLIHQALSKAKVRKPDDWLPANRWFDQMVARWLRRHPSAQFIGTETCALDCFQACERLGSTRILDCPQFHPVWLRRVMREAHERAGMQWQASAESSDPMSVRRDREYALAEHFLVYSPIHRESFAEAGFPAERIHEIPLWVEQGLWSRDAPRKRRSGPLRLLFVGSIGLRKGIPFLLEAARRFGSHVALTLVGTIDAAMHEWLARRGADFTYLPPCTKSDLRAIYGNHDLFVLPSVADSFGFVALEAMACGLPVITTDHCGVPVPDPDWRVPAMDPAALGARIGQYVESEEKCLQDGIAAETFAAQFTPERYRTGIRQGLRQWAAP